MDKTFAQAFLSHPEVKSFWDGLGFTIDLPDTFQFLFEDSVGLFALEPVDQFYGVHVAIPPSNRGVKAVAAGREAIAYGLTLGPKVLARVRRDQPQACYFAAQCGMTRYSQTAEHIFYEATSCQ